jgi:predicted DNA-binding transcriptional regulator AlpA
VVATLNDDEIMDTDEVAAFTKVKSGTLRYWRSIGEGPPWFRLGPRRIGYLRSDVERWLQAQIEQSYTDPSVSGLTSKSITPQRTGRTPRRGKAVTK